MPFSKSAVVSKLRVTEHPQLWRVKLENLQASLGFKLFQTQIEADFFGESFGTKNM